MPFSVTGTNPRVSTLGGARDTQQADLGNYFVARTPTLGTGIIGGASTQAFTETAPIFLLYNAGTSNIYPSQLRTHLTVVGANATPTIDNWTFTIDTGNRYTSGGTVLLKTQTNGPVAVNSAAFLVVGAVLATAATPARRIVAHLTTKADDEADGGVEVVHDTMVFGWGGTLTASSHSTRANTTTPCYTAYELPPVVIAPGQSFTAVRWSASQTTGSTMEYQFSWVEK